MFSDTENSVVYTITEDAVDHYTSVVNGYDITNTHKPELTHITDEMVKDAPDIENVLIDFYK